MGHELTDIYRSNSCCCYGQCDTIDPGMNDGTDRGTQWWQTSHGRACTRSAPARARVVTQEHRQTP